jgi:hypothetical protein
MSKLLASSTFAFILLLSSAYATDAFKDRVVGSLWCKTTFPRALESDQACPQKHRWRRQLIQWHSRADDDSFAPNGTPPKPSICGFPQQPVAEYD